jgi:5'-methylthioadenosine phosphorylase
VQHVQGEQIVEGLLVLKGVVIFGGTAAYHIDPADFATVVERRVVETPYGPSPAFYRLEKSLSENPKSQIPNPKSQSPISNLQSPHPKSKIQNPKSPTPSSIWYASRHGEGKLERSARFVNHRANLWAARALGVEMVLSWNGVGAINPALRVGEMVVPAAIMDWTRHRISSFQEEAINRRERGERREEKSEEGGARSVERGIGLFLAEGAALREAARTIDHIKNGRDPRQVANPFDERARQVIYSVLRIPYSESDYTQYAIGNRQFPVYVCTEGPRLETAAEIELAAELGADVVGMTLCPEVWLAAELGLAYASLCLVTNFATGRKQIDPRRDFGPSVAERGMNVLLAVAKRLTAENAEDAEKKREEERGIVE